MINKVYKVNDVHGELGAYGFHCPGCKCHHHFAIKGKMKWEFNGDMENPTFSPSLLVWASRQEERCHLFVRNGKIEYCGDSHHELAGQTIEMEDAD